MTPSLKPFLLVACAGLLLSTVSLVIWLTTNSTDADVAFGRVTEVATTTVLLSDRDGDITTVELASSTSLWRGKQRLGIEVLRVGDFVQVIGERTGRMQVNGTSIRIMKAPPGADKPKEHAQ